MNSLIAHYPNMKSLSIAVADLMLKIAGISVKSHKSFMLAISGGKTPQTLFEILTSSPYREKMPWRRTHIFWVDERIVPDRHPDNNFSTAFEILLSNIPIPDDNVHVILTDISRPAR